VNARTHTLAKIAYQGNVDFGNFVQPVKPNSTVSTRNDGVKFQFVEFLVHKQDEPCNVWDPFLDHSPGKAREPGIKLFVQSE
jgi:hypothetical protein